MNDLQLREFHSVAFKAVTDDIEKAYASGGRTRAGVIHFLHLRLWEATTYLRTLSATDVNGPQARMLWNIIAEARLYQLRRALQDPTFTPAPQHTIH
jgi:hypothetical protein